MSARRPLTALVVPGPTTPARSEDAGFRLTEGGVAFAEGSTNLVVRDDEDNLSLE